MKTVAIITYFIGLIVMICIYVRQNNPNEVNVYEIEKITYKKNGSTSGSMYHDAVKTTDGFTEKYKIIYSDTTLSNNTGIDSIEISIYPIINKVK